MFSDTVKLILSLSISGSILAMILFIIKPLTHNRLSKSFQYYIWLIVLARLVLPLSFDLNIINTLFKSTPQNTPTAQVQNTSIIQETSNSAQNLTTLELQNPEQSENEAIISSKNNNPIDTFLMIWALGAIIFLTWNVIAYVRFRVILSKTNKHLQLNKTLLPINKKVHIYSNQLVKTPLLLGLLNPKIIIPDVEYSNIELKNILLHELTHLKRYDVAIKWVVTVTTSIHWFNPLIYLIRSEINKACELSCDEMVIKNMDKESKQSYGDTLISIVSQNPHSIGVISSMMCEDKNTLKERLISIMNYKHKSKTIVLISTVLLLLFTGCAATLGAFTEEKTNETNKPIVYFDHEINAITLDGIKALAAKGSSLTFDDFKDFNGVNASSNLDTYLMVYSVEGEYRLVVSCSKDSNELTRASLESIWESNDKGIDIRKGNVDKFLNQTAYKPYTQDLLNKLLKHKTPYVGDNSKVANISSLLPAPNRRIKYDHIEALTASEPYGLIIYYEPINPDVYEQSNLDLDNAQLNKFCENNALLLFSLVDNLSEIKFVLNYPHANDVYLTSRINFNKYDMDKLWANNGKELLELLNNTESLQENTFINEDGENLNLEDVKMLAQKGDSLVMEDFEQYKGIDIGSGLYILYFDLGNDFELTVGSGELTGKPMYATLTQKGTDSSIDIRNENIDEFIKDLIDEYLDIIISSPKESSDVHSYIMAHIWEYDKILRMGYDGLPILNEILKSGDKSLRGNIVAQLSEEIMSSPPNDDGWQQTYKDGLSILYYWKVSMGYIST